MNASQWPFELRCCTVSSFNKSPCHHVLCVCVYVWGGCRWAHTNFNLNTYRLENNVQCAKILSLYLVCLSVHFVDDSVQINCFPIKRAIGNFSNFDAIIEDLRWAKPKKKNNFLYINWIYFFILCFTSEVQSCHLSVAHVSVCVCEFVSVLNFVQGNDSLCGYSASKPMTHSKSKRIINW